MLTTLPIYPISVLADGRLYLSVRFCSFSLDFSLIFEVVSVVIDLFFVCTATVDHCLLTALAETGKTAALHTSVFVALAPSTPLWQSSHCWGMTKAFISGPWAQSPLCFLIRR